jgi:hypothetical protein
MKIENYHSLNGMSSCVPENAPIMNEMKDIINTRKNVVSNKTRASRCDS